MARIKQIVRKSAQNNSAKYKVKNIKYEYTKKDKDKTTKYAYVKKVLVNGKYRYYYA